MHRRVCYTRTRATRRVVLRARSRAGDAGARSSAPWVDDDVPRACALVELALAERKGGGDGLNAPPFDMSRGGPSGCIPSVSLEPRTERVGDAGLDREAACSTGEVLRW